MSFLWASAKTRRDLESPNTPDALPDMTELEMPMVLPAINHKLHWVFMWAGCSLVLLHPPVEATEHICSPGSPATKLPHSVLLPRVHSAPNSEPVDFWPIIGSCETTAEVLTGSDPCHWYHPTPPGASRPPGQVNLMLSQLCFCLTPSCPLWAREMSPLWALGFSHTTVTLSLLLPQASFTLFFYTYRQFCLHFVSNSSLLYAHLKSELLDQWNHTQFNTCSFMSPKQGFVFFLSPSVLTSVPLSGHFSCFCNIISSPVFLILFKALSSKCFLLYIHCFPSKAILTLLKYESDPSVSGLSTDVGVFSVCSDYH